jgi:membrane protease YdiL (CAAX protease family)
MGKTLAAFNALYNKISLFPFIFALVLVWIYFWLNGPAHFPNWSEAYSEIMLYYLGMVVIFLFFAKRKTEQDIRQPIHMSLLSFAMFFIATTLVLTFIVSLGLYEQPEFDMSLFWPVIILQIFVVATAEELMFRGVLLPYVGVIIQAILFAVWHSYAYQIQYYEFSFATFNWPILLMAFIMGTLLGIVAKSKYGIPACIGIHAAWNIVIIGAFAL